MIWPGLHTKGKRVRVSLFDYSQCYVLVVRNKYVLDIRIGRDDQISNKISYTCAYFRNDRNIGIGGSIYETIREVVILMHLCCC